MRHACAVLLGIYQLKQQSTTPLRGESSGTDPIYYATHLIKGGYDILTVQELLGHRSVETTMIYTHVMNKDGRGAASPLDARLHRIDAAEADSPRYGDKADRQMPINA